MAKFSGLDQLSSINKNAFTLKFVALTFESVDKSSYVTRWTPFNEL